MEHGTEMRKVKLELENGHFSGTFKYPNLRSLIRDLILIATLLGWGKHYYSDQELQHRLDVAETTAKECRDEANVLKEVMRGNGLPITR